MQALAVGAQMKMAHKLRSAEQISRRELARVLKGSIGTSFEVDPAELEVMIAGIMKVRLLEQKLEQKYIYIRICLYN